MATGAKGGIGTKLQVGDGASPTETFSDVGDLKDVNSPELRAMIEDATVQDSASGFVEKVPVGVIETGSVTFQLHFKDNDTQQGLMRNDLLSGVKRNYRIVPRGSAAKRWAFAGYVESIGSSYPVKGIMVTDVTIVPTGPVTYESTT